MRLRPIMRRIAGDEKMQEFERCPFGIIGLETAIGLSLERLYHAGGMSACRIWLELFTTNPARILSLDRGTLRTGAPGDVTIFGLSHRMDYDVNNSASKSRNTPFHGHHFTGGPIATVVSGKIVWRADQ